MATCHFCGRRFTNTQAVYAHLRGCPAYQERDHAGPALGSVASGSVPKAYGPETLETSTALAHRLVRQASLDGR